MKLEGQIKDTELKGSYRIQRRKAIFKDIIDEEFFKLIKEKKTSLIL